VGAGIPRGNGFFCILEMSFMTPELRSTPTANVQSETIRFSWNANLSASTTKRARSQIVE
jgi:hypothetical protein